MPRPERPVDLSMGPVPRFAEDLRCLRASSGITYRELAKAAHFSKATLSAAAAGHRVPTWEVTRAYVQACGGDVGEWELKWRTTRAEIGLTPEPPLRVDRKLQPAPERVAERRRRLFMRALIGCVIVVVVVGIAVVWARLGSPDHRTERAPTSSNVRFTGAQQQIADNNDPKKTRCAYDPGVTTLDQVEINTAHEKFLGLAQLRYSPQCQVAWGRFMPSGRMIYFKQASIAITARRPATGTTGVPYQTAFDGQAVFGNILTTRHGCVEITVVVRASTGSGSGTTNCRR
jgi:transcriptional regulator with XRE-family HTH domain